MQLNVTNIFRTHVMIAVKPAYILVIIMQLMHLLSTRLRRIYDFPIFTSQH